MTDLFDKRKELVEAIKEKQEGLDSFDVADYLDESIYDDTLDDCYGDFMGYSASMILKMVDPTAYRCGFLDYCDGVDKSELREYTDLKEKLEELEQELEDVEEAIEELKGE